MERGSVWKEVPGVTDRRFEGIVAHLDEQNHYGSIDCQKLREIYDCDVFLPSFSGGTLRIGDPVSFGVCLSRENYPQAKDVVCENEVDFTNSGLDEDDAELLFSAEARFVGKIVAFQPQGYGFIHCDEVFERYQRDVFLGKAAGKGRNVGDVVSFGISMGRLGFPQAKDVGLVEDARPPAGAPEDVAVPRTALDVPGLTDQRFTGRILHFHKDMYFGTSSFGFVECFELRAIFGNDIYVNQFAATGFGIDDIVTFGIWLSGRGRGQAVELMRAPRGAVVSPDGTDLGRCAGRIKLHGPCLPFCFVECPELQGLFDRDVYLHGDPAEEGLADGDEVSVRVTLHQHGLLAARDMRRLCGASSSAFRDGGALGGGQAAVAASQAQRSEAGRRRLSACAQAAGRLLPECGPREMAGLAWAVAALQYDHPPLRDAIAAAAIATITDAASTAALPSCALPQTLSSMPWAVSSLSFQHRPLLHSISASALRTLREFWPAERTATAWSMSVLHVAAPPLRKALSAAALANSTALQASALANTAWS